MLAPQYFLDSCKAAAAESKAICSNGEVHSGFERADGARPSQGQVAARRLRHDRQGSARAGFLL